MNKKFLFTLVPVLGLAMLFGFTGSSVTTPTQFLSIPPAAFIPFNSSTVYNHNGYALFCGGYCVLDTPVYLDQGMVVSKVTLYYYDYVDSSADLTLQLFRTDNVGNHSYMAELDSGDDGTDSTSDSTINYAVIDNINYAYTLALSINSGGAMYYRAVIEYSYPNGIALPLVSRN